MRATSVLMILLTAAVSCQKPLFSGTPRWMRMQDRYKYMSAPLPKDDSGDTGGENPEEEGPSVYLSALRFPDGQYWRSGDLSGAHLVLWKDGEEVLDIPAGHYPEPDRHRIRDGHLWWDDSDGSSTYLYMDEEVLLHYDGDEILRGFLDVDGDLHTLGQRVGSNGFSYRVNGVEVFSHPSAKVVGSFDDREWEGGALMRDGEDVYFTYALPIRSGNETLWEYHVMQGGQPLLTVPAGDAAKVYDIRVWKGSVYRSEQRGPGGSSLVLVRDNTLLSLGVKDDETVHLCRLVPSGGEMLVKGYSTRKGQSGYSYWLRGKNGPVQLLDSQFPVADLYPDNPNRIALYLENGKIKEIWGGKRYLNMLPGRYTLYTSACSTLYDGALYAVLSDATDNSHLLLQGEQFRNFTFNGCFTGVRIE